MRIGKMKRLLLKEFEGFCKKNSVRPTERENVVKMLSCRTPLLGHHLYVCKSCGDTVKIPHSCKSRLCSVCGTLASEQWINKQFTKLLECPYQHVVVTVPFDFYWIIKRMRSHLLNEFARLSALVIQEWARKRGYEVAIVSFFHSFGKNLQFHPHFHMLVTSGGITPQGTWKHEKAPFPGHILMPRFKAKFTSVIKDALRSGKIKTKLPIAVYLKKASKTHDTHWQFYTAVITKRSHATILYIVRYVKRMILSEKRIVSITAQEVSFFDSLGTKGKLLVYKIDQFIRCVIQHIPEKHFRHIRYYGFYSNAAKRKYQIAAQLWPTIKESKNKLSWQIRQWTRIKKDPLYCTTCQQAYELIEVRNPRSWVYFSYDQLREANDQSIQLKLKWEPG